MEALVVSETDTTLEFSPEASQQLKTTLVETQTPTLAEDEAMDSLGQLMLDPMAGDLHDGMVEATSLGAWISMFDAEHSSVAPDSSEGSYQRATDEEHGAPLCEGNVHFRSCLDAVNVSTVGLQNTSSNALLAAGIRPLGVEEDERDRSLEALVELARTCYHEAVRLARELALRYDGPWRELVRLQAHCLANEAERECSDLLPTSRSEHHLEAVCDTSSGCSWRFHAVTGFHLECAVPRKPVAHGERLLKLGASALGPHQRRPRHRPGKRDVRIAPRHRKQLTRPKPRTDSNHQVSRVLKQWLFDHFLNPYPTDEEKHELMRQTGLTFNQLNNWFINARVRLWKPLVNALTAKRRQSLPV